jgi:hypothetical protein
MGKTCQLHIRRLGGSVVLIGIVLSLVVHPWGIGLSLFAALNMIQSSFTEVCPAKQLLPACESVEAAAEVGQAG